MTRPETSIHELRRRFVRGLLLELSPPLLREFVTGVPEDEEDDAIARDAA